MIENQMRLEELFGREMAFHWYEGVAIIQAACREQLGRGGSDVFPTASQILLGRDGSVGILPATGRGAVTTAARLLSSMLSDDVPVRLRLIVTQATGADTAYPTLLEFSNALAYFERPDGTQVLRALTERAAVAPLRPTGPEYGAAAAPLEQHTPADPPQPGSRPRSHLRLVVGAAVTAGCLCAAWLGASAGGYDRLGVALTTFAGVTPSQTDALEASPPKAVGTVGGRSPGRRTASGKAPANAAAKSAATSRTGGKGLERSEATGVRRNPSGFAAVPPLNPVSTSFIWSPPEFRSMYAETVEVTASVAEMEPEEEESLGERIYTGADAEVVPPRSVYPKLPPDTPPPASAPDKRTVLELLIGTNGLVERARLRSIPHDVHEFMLVSAAKAWIFEPATRDGQPVRFRHRVLIALP